MARVVLCRFAYGYLYLQVLVIGRVLEVGAEEAIVWNDKYTTIRFVMYLKFNSIICELSRCTKLAWSGGCKRSNATGLNDVVSTGLLNFLLHFVCLC